VIGQSFDAERAQADAWVGEAWGGLACGRMP
jgi:hypothetical protein